MYTVSTMKELQQNSEKTVSARNYLSAEKRRQFLLEAAADVIAENGWAALTMSGLAKSAGVSRQLIYDHFGDGKQLYYDVLHHLFTAAFDSIRAVADEPLIGEAVTRRLFGVYLELPAEQRSALRSLARDQGSQSEDLQQLKSLMRKRIQQVWSPFLQRRTELPKEELRALAWVITVAAWAIEDHIANQSLDQKRALDLLVAIVDGTLTRLENN